MKGKLGNTVAYRLKNSNNRETQGFRVYQPNVSNPQTDQQLDQRVKMAVVTNEYRALRDVIRRGMQSFEYGDPSRRAWLSMALGAEFVGPYLEKGDKLPLPMPNVPISVGGLPEVVCNYVDEDGNARTSLVCSEEVSPTTLGNVTRQLIADNPWMQEGDQLTVVFCVPSLASPSELAPGYYYEVHSVVLDLSSTQGIENFGIDASKDEDLNVWNFANASYNAVACAVIVSREGAAGEHLRSTAKFGFADSITNYYASLDPAQARRSYKKGITAESDWPVEQEAGVGTTPIDAKLLNGGTASVTDLAVVDGYLKASGYFLKFTALNNPKYNRYFTSMSSSSANAPDGATNTNTIAVDTSSSLAIDQRFVAWLLDHGVPAQWLYLGEN